MKILLSLLSILFTLHSYGQLNEELRIKERKKTQRLFDDNFLRNKQIDTNEMVIFAAKVKVDNTEDKLRIKSIELSDSTRMHYFKNFDFLNTINYNLLTEKRGKDLSFVFPVFLFITYEKERMNHDLYGNYFYKNMNNLFFIKDTYKEPIEDYIYSFGIILWSIREELY